MTKLKCIGISGWKDSGKTTLAAGLVAVFSSRGLRISTIKHAHHSFDLDTPGTDSYRHREAGANEVAIVSANRWAIQHELKESNEPTFDEILEKLAPCDLVLVEGYKRERFPKIEVIGNGGSENPIWKVDSEVLAIASDTSIEDCHLPIFPRDQHEEIADFILTRLGIKV